MGIHDILFEIDANGKRSKKEYANANIIEAECGTNGWMGGDTGHGGRSFISIKDMGCTDWNIIVERGEYGDLKGFKLFFGGDAELDTISEALYHMGDELRHMAHDLAEERKNGRKILKPTDPDYYPCISKGEHPLEQLNELIEQARELKTKYPNE